MARIRTIKPEFWTDEKIGNLSYFERLFFLGMWTVADDEGLLKANPTYLKSTIFPYDDISSDAVSQAINKLESESLITKYSINNQNYIWVIKFRVHQRIDKPQKPVNPCPSIQNRRYQDAIHKRDGYICHLCGEMTEISNSTSNKNFPSIDHLIPISKNGSNFPSNLKTACISCNKSRGNKDMPMDNQEHSENIHGIFQEHSETEREKEREREKEKELKATTCSEPEKASDSELFDLQTENQKSGLFDCQQKTQPDITSPTQEAQPPVIEIPLVCKKTGPLVEFGVTQAMVDDWAESYPGVDIMQSLREIRQWNISNPLKRKTKSGIMHHVTTWLAKAQNNGGSTRQMSPTTKPEFRVIPGMPVRTVNNINAASAFLERQQHEKAG